MITGLVRAHSVPADSVESSPELAEPAKTDTMRASIAAASKAWMLTRGRRPLPKELAESAMVFAPHPDDETLGCGGTIARKRQMGARVRVVFMTSGERSHVRVVPTRLGSVREREARRAVRELGVEESDVEFLRFPDGNLAERREEAVARVASVIARHVPKEVYVPHRWDGPPDHGVTTEVVFSALRMTGMPVQIYEYPVWLWNSFPWVPFDASGGLKGRITSTWRAQRAFLGELRWVVPVADMMAHKRRALACYQSQVRRPRGQAEWRTLSDVSGGEWVRCLLGDYELFRRDRICCT